MWGMDNKECQDLQGTQYHQECEVHEDMKQQYTSDERERKRYRSLKGIPFRKQFLGQNKDNTKIYLTEIVHEDGRWIENWFKDHIQWWTSVLEVSNLHVILQETYLCDGYERIVTYYLNRYACVFMLTITTVFFYVTILKLEFLCKTVLKHNVVATCYALWSSL